MRPPDRNFGVIMPVYNEPRLALLLARFDFQVTPRVVVVDDGSDDGSTEVCRRYPVSCLRHEKRRGACAAIRTGLLHLKKSGIEVAVVMAGNNKDDPAEVPRLLSAIDRGADYVQGSRFLEPSNAAGTPPFRRLLTWLVAALWSLRFGRRLTEATNGYRAYKLAILDDPRMNIEQDWLDQYELEYYLQYKVLSLGFRYAEVPVTKVYPRDGKSTSKIRLWRHLWSLMRPLVLLTLRLRH